MQISLDGFNTEDTLYIPKEENGTVTMWLASPSANYNTEIMTAYKNGTVGNNGVDYNQNGFKPVVCLKNDTELKLSSDGSSYEIVE